MKKIIPILSILIVFASGLAAQSLTVADGTVTNRYFPVYGLYMDVAQKSHTLYPANLLTNLQGTQITGLTYYFQMLPVNAWGGTQVIRMGITSSSQLNGAFNTAPVTTVWTGTLSNHIVGSTLVISLDVPFAYTGGNLLIEIENINAADWNDSYFFGLNQSTQLSYMTYYSTYNNTHTPKAASFLPKTTFEYASNASGCMLPSYLTARDIGVDSVVLSWISNPIQPATSYTVAYKKISDTIYTEITVTDTFLNLTGLQASAEYVWRIRSNCSTEMSGWKSGGTFITLQHPAQLPYQCGFEDAAENSEWGIVHTDDNQWHVGQATARNGNSALYVTNNGEDNAYTLNFESVSWAYRDIQLTPGYPEYQVSFDFKGVGKNGQDYARVFLGPQVVLIGSRNPTGSVQLGGTFVLERDWKHFSFTVDSSFAGLQRLYFLWYNYSSNGAQPPAAIDNIRVEGSFCTIPVSCTTRSVTDSSATVSWNTVPGAAYGYEVAYRLVTDTAYATISVTDTFCVLSGLVSNSDYFWMVRSRCSINDASAWSNEQTFHTPIAIGKIPFHCDFENGIENNNWQFVNPNANKWCVGSSACEGGMQGLYVSNDNGAHNKSSSGSFSAWAYRDIYIDSTFSDVILTFDYRNANMSANSAKVFMGSPVTPSGNAVPQNAVQLGGALSTSVHKWETAGFFIDSTRRGLQRLYFLSSSDGSYFNADNQPFAIDNITIENTSCSSPFALKVVSMDSAAALLSWAQSLTGNPGSYTVAYKQEDDQDFTIITVADTFLLLTGLSYSTPYVWKVRSHCSQTEQSDWSVEKRFTSAPFVSSEPYCCDFEDTIENAQWRFVVMDTNARWTIGQALNHGGSSSLYVSGDGGQTNTSSHPNTNLAYTLAYRDIYFPPSASEYLISFDSKESPCEYTNLTIWAGEPITDMSIFANDGHPIGAKAVYYFSDYFEGDTTWRHHNIIVNSTYAGMQRLYFHWYESGSYACPAAAAFDNLCVTPITCGIPTTNTPIVADTSAIFSWTPSFNGTPDTYTLAYRQDSDTVFTEVTVADTTYTLTGLHPITNYSWRVRANCTDSTSSLWTSEQSFATQQRWVGLPYYCDFEDADENANWQATSNQSSQNVAYIGSAVASSGQNSMYISNDNGQTNSYTREANKPVSLNREIHFTPGYPQYQIAFDCKGGGTSLLGYMQVIIDNTYNISGYLNDANFWTRKSITLDSSYAGTHTLQLLFNFCTGVNPPGAFDNISIKGIMHGIPGSLTTTDITDHTAKLSWHPDLLGVPQSYQLAYRAQHDTAYTMVSLTSADTVYQLTGLTHSSWYVWKVRAGYANDEWSEWGSEKAFQTLAQLPYYCDFEDATENESWAIRNGDDCWLTAWWAISYDYTNKWHIGMPADASGNTLLFISGDEGVTNTYALQNSSFVWAYRDIYLTPGYFQYQLSLDFKGMGEDGNDYVRLFLDDPTDPPLRSGNSISFAQIGETLNLTDHWEHKSFVIDSSHAGAQRLYILWNNNNSNGFNPPAAIDNISITIVSCSAPETLTHTVLDTTATLSWSAGHVGDVNSYILSYKMLIDSIYTEIPTTDTQYTLNGLLPLTDYIWRVKSVCSASDTSEWSAAKVFTTPQTLNHLPYLCRFDATTENSLWTLQNGNNENQWVIGNGVGYDDGTALFVTNDNGTSHAYTLTSSSSVWAYRDVFFDEGYAQYQLSFDFLGMGQDNIDYMKVFVGPPAIPTGTALPAGAVQLDGTFSSMKNWTHYAFTLDSSYTGVRRLYFLWTNNNSDGTQPPVAIDNITVIGTDCALPTELAIADMTGYSATLVWSPGASSAGSYTVSVRQAGQTTTMEYTTSDTFYVVNGLVPSTEYVYKVRTNCIQNTQSAWCSDFHFQTPAVIPYFCDFEDAHERDIWKMVNGSYINKWYVGNAVCNGGDYSLYISNNGGTDNAYSWYSCNVWAYRDIYLDPADSAFVLSFDVRSAGAHNNNLYAYLNVYLGTPTTPSGNTIPTGAVLLEQGIRNILTWTSKSYVLDASHSGWQRLYFLWTTSGSILNNPPAAIDNIRIEGTTCVNMPANLTAQVMDSIAFLSWTVGDSAVSYTVQYKMIEDSTYSELTVQDNQATICNLTPLSNYVWKVRSNCTATDHSFWSVEADFQTTDNIARIPYICDFEDFTENGHWTLLNGTYANQWYVGTAVNNGGSHSLYVSNDSGATNTYSFTSSAIWAYRDIYIDPQYSDYELSFDYRGYGKLNNSNPVHFAKVFLGPPTTPSTSTNTDVLPVGATQMGDVICMDSNWRNVTVGLDHSYTGLKRIYICWCNNSTTGANPPAAIDNISIVPVSCGAPHNLTANSIVDVSAVLSWSAVYQSSFYKLIYRNVSDTVYTEVTCSNNHYILTGLTPMTTYVFKVKALCDNATEGAWSQEAMFTTTQNYATLPYFCGFEDSIENKEWHLLNVAVNQWHIGQAAHQSGNYGLYVSNDQGATNAYTINGAMSNSWAYRDIYFDPSYSEYQLSFDFRGVGRANDDRVRLFVGPPVPVSANSTYTITLPAQAEEIGSGLCLEDVWTSHSYTLDSTHAGFQRLYFLWTNDIYQGTNPPGAIDNIMIYGGSCAGPFALTVDSISRHSISFSFTPANADGQSWQAVIVPNGQPIDTSQIVFLTDTFYTFTNLQDDTPYSIYVRTDCGYGLSSWSSINQRTECGLVTALPYQEPFDAYGTGGDMNGNSAYPRCWNRLYSSYIVYPRPFIYANGAFSAPGSLYFQPSNGYQVAITPEFDASIPLNTLQVEFKLRGITNAANAYLMVGVMTDPNDYSTFVPVDTVFPNPYALTTWTDRTVSLASYTGQGHYIAFAQECYTTTLTPVGLDNVIIDHIASCPQPTSVSAVAIGYDNIMVDWQPVGSETLWQVVAVPLGTGPSDGTPVQVTTHPCNIGGLNENTLYDVYVKAICGTDNESPWGSAVSVKTFCAPIGNLPYTENFESYNTQLGDPDCWTFPVKYGTYPKVDWNTYGVYGMETKALVFSSDTLTSPVAVSPAFDVDIHSLRAQFRISASHLFTAGCMEVGVMSDPNDMTTFESVQIFSVHGRETWEDCSVDFRFTNMTGTGRYIAFRQVGTHDEVEMWLDDLVVTQAPYCDAPAALTVSSILTNMATLTFVPSQSSDSQWEYVVCQDNAGPDSQSPVNISNTTFTIANLVSGQTYSVYVRTVCPANQYSAWSAPLTITTDCNLIGQLPYVEPFDSYGTDSETAFPDCWRRLLNTASYLYYPAIASDAVASGNGSLEFFSNEFSEGWAVAPGLATSLSLDSLQVDFKYYAVGTSVHGWDTMIVGVMTSPYNKATFVSVDTFTLQNFGVWEPKTVLFDNYQGNGRYVVFRYHCPAYMGMVYIDDVVFSVRSDVGINNHAVGCSLNIYPNPTNGQFTIRDSQNILEKAEVFDIYGKLIEQVTIYDYQTTLDLSLHASGVYFVRTFTKHGVVTKRVVKR